LFLREWHHKDSMRFAKPYIYICHVVRESNVLRNALGYLLHPAPLPA